MLPLEDKDNQIGWKKSNCITFARRDISKVQKHSKADNKMIKTKISCKYEPKNLI